MIGKGFIPLLHVDNFKGVNTKDSSENMSIGEWDDSSINIFSDPQGALSPRLGYTAVTSASIGASAAFCGIFQLDVHSGGSTTPHYIAGGSDGKLYEYESNQYTELFTGLTTGVNERWSFFTLDNTAICVNGNEAPLAYTGTGSAATFATSVTADFGMEWQRYGWLHSTVDPRLMYYCTTLGDPDSAYTSFLNFDEDPGVVTGVAKSGDDMIVGKALSLFRVEYRGTDPLFVKYRIPAKVGPVCHWVMQELPNGKVIFLAPDYNFYVLSGNSVDPIGDNIRKYVKAGVNSRVTKAVSGLLYSRQQYWCSFTYVSGATTNDRTVVMDWSRPYQDKWGKLQYPWFIYDVAANAYGQMTVSSKTELYHGDYGGKMHKNDTGTNDDGTAINNTYKMPLISHGDPTLEKKFTNINLSYARKGDWDLGINIICDGNANTEKIIAENMLGGLGYQSLFDVAKFDEDYFSSESDADRSREILRQGKTIQVTLGTNTLDEDWLLYNFTIHARPLRRGVRIRESS